MPFVSDLSHQKNYEEPPNMAARIADVETAIQAILHMKINAILRKRLIKECVWEITNIQGDFKGRYRSQGVMTMGFPIQRDHVWQKSKIIQRILRGEQPVHTILDDIVHCVVTKAEHDRLTQISKMNKEIDGWDRYKAADIAVRDMLTGNRHC